MDSRIGRRGFMGGGLALAAAPVFAQEGASAVDWHALAADVRAEMRWAWANYRAHAWGRDQILPISGGYESFPLKTHHLGLSLIEAMDTLWVMGLDAEFAEAQRWVRAHLSFDVDGEVSVFETAIRLLGGLLSAHHASGDPMLLAHARDLGNRLLPAFATPTGMPHRFVNLRTGATRGTRTNPAEIGTYLPEFGTLSRLTGDPRYHDAAKRAQVALFARRSTIGLLADGIDSDTGIWLTRRATVGPPSDSYYEYLWDGWQLFGDRDCKAMYDVCTAAIVKYQAVRAGPHTWFGDVDFETGGPLSAQQDELAAFYGGLLAQGGAPALGAAYTRAWAAVQDRFGILPEGYDYLTGEAFAPTNALRPELADAAFNHWLLDRAPEWRMIGRTNYLNMKRFNRARFGYAQIEDMRVQPMVQSDHCPGYWWSEQMKYYYLLFSDTPRFDYARNYLSTEGNVLLGLRNA
ncbi:MULTISPECIES: glycoside hydrolase family 47 protein [unclassified Sphingomonas]|uniref:glycoside hydrolase family 47 protein n=1 Tax=unclassified Sphingomonas TaxID=196159 RepID=UPI00226A7462